MVRKRLLAAMALVLLLASCHRPVAFPAAISTDVPPAAATGTSTPTLSTPTVTSEPTATPEPTAPPTPTATPTVKVTPTQTDGTPTATPVLTEMENRTWSSRSPDGKWDAQGMVAFPVDGGEKYYTQLKVNKTDGAVEWTVVDEWSRWGLGYTTPQPFHWSRDGRYLYFTNEPVPDGCGLFVNGSDLHRIDLSDGSVKEIVPSSGLWLSLSPDETTLAYIGYKGRGLVVRDLATGLERETGLDPGQDYAAGHIVWSPDGAALVLTLAIHPCSFGWAESVSVVLVEVATLKQTMLIHEDRRLLITVEWPALDRILLEDNDGSFWWMDLETRQITTKK
jgi:hypothetical protein